MNALRVEVLRDSFRPWLADLLIREWGSEQIVTRGKVHNAAQLTAYVALMDDKPVGAITYRMIDDECEIVTLDSLIEGKGAATALLNSVKECAGAARCRRLWLITTNDNVEALRFYQRRGFRLRAVYPGAIEESRRLKPEIPLAGRNGIPLRDEIELEIVLQEVGMPSS